MTPWEQDFAFWSSSDGTGEILVDCGAAAAGERRRDCPAPLRSGAGPVERRRRRHRMPAARSRRARRRPTGNLISGRARGRRCLPVTIAARPVAGFVLFVRVNGGPLSTGGRGPSRLSAICLTGVDDLKAFGEAIVGQAKRLGRGRPP